MHGRLRLIIFLSFFVLYSTVLAANADQINARSHPGLWNFFRQFANAEEIKFETVLAQLSAKQKKTFESALRGWDSQKILEVFNDLDHPHFNQLRQFRSVAKELSIVEGRVKQSHLRLAVAIAQGNTDGFENFCEYFVKDGKTNFKNLAKTLTLKELYAFQVGFAKADKAGLAIWQKKFKKLLSNDSNTMKKFAAALLKNNGNRMILGAVTYSDFQVAAKTVLSSPPCVTGKIKLLQQ